MLRLYNSLTKKKEIFVLLSLKNKKQSQGKNKKIVTMYNCGPTVYDYVHLGNLRSFLFADLLRRYLEWKGYQVKQVMNITDVGHMRADIDVGEDKIEETARRERKSPWAIAAFYTRAFFRDIRRLNIKPAWKYPRATQHIKEMVNLIEKLLKKRVAYQVNGSVYFDLSKFPRYGKLSGNTVTDLVAGGRVGLNPEKKNPYDFALWIEDSLHLMKWRAPWSIKGGYPGWHIECSAMAMHYLGKTIDIHTGGEDNKFPHHECEIAQAESATGKTFVRFWLHVKHLLVEGQKMAKSLGNFYTLDDILQRGFSSKALRYLLLSAHYRDTLNFTFDSLKSAEEAVKRLEELVLKLLWREKNFKKIKQLVLKDKQKRIRNIVRQLIKKTRQGFEEALDDDLNTPQALACLFQFIQELNVIFFEIQERKIIKAVRELLLDFDEVLGLGLEKIRFICPQGIQKLAEDREKARREKDWLKADALREKIKKHGYLIEDTPVGWFIKKTD
jgi:cysteinyl-tRNA synthetase